MDDIARAALAAPDTPPTYTQQTADPDHPSRTRATPDTPPEPAPTAKHEFVGPADRWCEVCNLPDRNPIHKP
jgi:hypothetical protein